MEGRGSYGVPREELHRYSEAFAISFTCPVTYVVDALFGERAMRCRLVRKIHCAQDTHGRRMEKCGQSYARYGVPRRVSLHYCKGCWEAWLRRAMMRNKSDWLTYAASLHDEENIVDAFKRAGTRLRSMTRRQIV